MRIAPIVTDDSGIVTDDSVIVTDDSVIVTGVMDELVTERLGL